MKATFMARAALICVPLLLAPPLFQLGPYGITLPEVIVTVAGFGLLLAFSGPVPRFPRVVIVYLILLVIGWLGSMYNAYDWSVPVGPSNVAFLYSPVLALLAYVAGRYSSRHLEEIVAHPFTKVVLVSVAVFAITYPFLSISTRQLAFALFVDNTEMRRLASPRFPGIGINANMYAFMAYPIFLFGFNAYLAKRVSAVVPVAAGIIIVAAASRTVIGIMVLGALVLLASSLRQVRARRRAPGRLFRQHRSPKSRRRIMLVTASFVALLSVGVVYGAQVRTIFTIYDRIEELFGLGEHIGGGGLEGRREMWAMGMKRVGLAPVLGIPKDTEVGEIETNPLYFYTPHNEFIYFWSTFGIVGLFAHLYLIARCVLMNARARAELTWMLFYAGMAVQMAFDAVFQAPRTVVFVFLLVGLNFKYLASVRPARPTAEALAPVPAPATA